MRGGLVRDLAVATGAAVLFPEPLRAPSEERRHMTEHILHVVTNVSHYDDPSHSTGLWLSELAHAWEVFEGHGFRQTIVSPQGGKCPLEPRSLKFPNYDRAARAWRGDAARMALLQSTLNPERI